MIVYAQTQNMSLPFNAEVNLVFLGSLNLTAIEGIASSSFSLETTKASTVFY